MERLQTKLIQNREHREKDYLLNTRPKNIIPIFKQAKIFCAQDYFQSLPVSPFSNFKEDKLLTKKHYKTYSYIKFERRSHVKDYFSNAKLTFDSTVAIHLGIGSLFLFNDPLEQNFLIALLSILEAGKIESI